MKHVLTLFFLIIVETTSIQNYNIYSKVDACIRPTMVRSSDPTATSEDIFECLVQARITRVDSNFISQRIGPAIELLAQAETERNNKQTYIAKQDRLYRQKLKSIQRDMIMVVMKLTHYSKMTHVPKFSLLSTRRTLDSVEQFSGDLHNAGDAVAELTKIIKPHVQTTNNIKSHIEELDQLKQAEEDAWVHLNEVILDLKNLVLTLYDAI